MIYAIANQKGGVGKTTTTMNLGVALARLDKRVLLIDNDPQANLTSYLGLDPEGEIPTLDEVYLAKGGFSAERVDSLIYETDSGVDLIPSSQHLSGVEYFLFSRSNKEKILYQALQEVGAKYDFVLIDNPPSLNLLTLNALFAADRVLIPIQPEFFSLEGIVKIRQAIKDIRESWNPKLEIGGILPTQVSSRRKLTHQVIDSVREEFDSNVFQTMIHNNAAVTESTGHGKSVIDYQRGSRGAKEYMALAKEILDA